MRILEIIKKYYAYFRNFAVKYIAFIILFFLGVLHLLGYLKFDWPVIVVFALALFPAIAPLIKSLRVSKEGFEFEMSQGKATKEEIEKLNREEPLNSNTFSAFSLEAKRVLKSLWHFQKKLYGPDNATRWGFTVGSGASNYKDFLSGVGFLIGKNLIVTDLNQMVYLKNEGIDFCNSNDSEINSFPLYYREFDAP